MSITTKIDGQILVTQRDYVGPADNISSLNNNVSDRYAKTITPTHVHVIRQSIAASGTLTIDLDGALADLFGTTAAFATITGLHIINHSDAPRSIDGATAAAATDADCVIGGDFITTEYGASTSIPLPAGAQFLHGPMSLDVTATSGDQITITNSDAENAAYVDVVIVGTAA